MQLALALICRQRWAEGASTLRQLLVLKPDSTQAHYNLGLCLAKIGDSPGAIASYQEALRCTPGQIGSHLALADELARAGRLEEARAHLQDAMRIDANDPRITRLRDRIPAE
jgi:Flp pilus assembly protein TadD